jgi:hypothetical protein
MQMLLASARASTRNSISHLTPVKKFALTDVRSVVLRKLLLQLAIPMSALACVDSAT